MTQRATVTSPSVHRGDEVGSERAPVAAPLAVVVAAALLVLMQLYVAIPLAPVIGTAFGGAGSLVLNTAYGLAYAVGFVLWGPISDRYGRKAVLVPGMAALALATAGLVAAPSLPVIGLLRAVQGFIAASFAAVALAYVGEVLPPRWRSSGIGAVSTAFLVAGLVGQVYAQAVVLLLGWRWVFALAAAAFAVIVMLMATVLAEPVRTGPLATLGQRFSQMAGLLTRRDMILPYLAAMTVLLTFVAMYAALGPLLQARFGLDPSDIMLVRLAGLPGMVLAPLAGGLAGRFGPGRVAITGFLVAAVGSAVAALSTGMLWALVVASAVFVAGIATTMPSLIGLVGARAGQARAGGLGLYGLALFLGASAGPIVVGFGIGFTSLLLSMAVLLVLSAGLVAGSTPRSTRI